MKPDPFPPRRPLRASIQTTAGLTRSAVAVTASEYGSRRVGASAPTRERNIVVTQNLYRTERLRVGLDRDRALQAFTQRRVLGHLLGERFGRLFGGQLDEFVGVLHALEECADFVRYPEENAALGQDR